MKRSLSKLQVLALAINVIEHVSIAEAEHLIERCNNRIKLCKAEPLEKLREYALQLIPNLQYLYASTETFSADIIICYTFAHIQVHWFGQSTKPTLYIVRDENNIELAIECPVSLETHRKCVDFFKSYQC